jgi:hypothetical protein
MLPARAVPRGYKEDKWGNKVSSVKKRMSWKGAEKSPLLEAVTRERLVKNSR